MEKNPIDTKLENPNNAGFKDDRKMNFWRETWDIVIQLGRSEQAENLRFVEESAEERLSTLKRV